MANQIWLLQVPILTLFLISNGVFAGRSNRMGLFDIISKIPQYFDDSSPQTYPDGEINAADCKQVSPKAYEQVEQILNLALDTLAELTVEGCASTMTEAEPELSVPDQSSSYLPTWPTKFPLGMSDYLKPWMRRAHLYRRNRVPALLKRRAIGAYGR